MKRSPMLRVTPPAASSRTVKLRKCAVCRALFLPRSMTHKACGAECAVKVSQAAAAKLAARAALDDRKQTRAQLEALKTRSDWIKETQRVVNQFVRMRDRLRGCISCKCALSDFGTGGGADAGHFRSRGAAPHLRFELNNIHAQCKRCNRYLAGNATEYRAGLVDRYGIAYVQSLEADQMPRRHSIDDMEEIRRAAKLGTTQLKKANHEQ